MQVVPYCCCHFSHTSVDQDMDVLSPGLVPRRHRTENPKAKTQYDINKARRDEIIERLPKVELHVHIEGCLEPELALEMARRNNLMHQVPFDSVESAKKAFQFRNLQEFLDIRDATLRVMQTEEDFYDVTMLYLRRVAAQNVVHAEIFFDPQVHTMRGIPFATFMRGFHRGLKDAAQFGISAKLICCFMTELGPDNAMAHLEEALKWREDIVAVGLARGIPNWTGPRYPHTSFKAVIERAKAEGFMATAHAGEEGPPTEIWDCLKELQVSRIDHGVQCMEDERLLDYLEMTRIPLTVCPRSNHSLKIYDGVLLDKMQGLLERDICVTVNSDDPPFFGGYMNENYQFWADAFDFGTAELFRLGTNSVMASFLPTERKQALLEELGRWMSECASLSLHSQSHPDSSQGG